MQPSPDDISAAAALWNYMFFHSDPISADVIIGLGCHELSVADDVAELYARGIAQNVVFSGNVGRATEGLFHQSEARMMRDRAVTLGVPSGAILLEEASTNTGENMRFTQRLLSERGIHASRIVFVHPPYMLRRDYATFMKQWEKASDIEVSFWAKSVEPEAYLKNSDTASETISIIVGDLQRLETYPEYGYEVEQVVPPDVQDAFHYLVDHGYTEHLLVP